MAEATQHEGELIAASVSVPSQFSAVAARHFAEIYRYLARRVGRELAEDLTADTFYVAFRRRSSFDPSTADAGPWLYGIATNMLRRHARAERRRWAAYARVGSEADERTDPFDEVDHRLAAAARAAALAVAIAELDRKHRDVINLVTLQGLSYEAAAEALQIPIGTVRSRLARARARLQQRLTDLDESHSPSTDSGGRHAR